MKAVILAAGYATRLYPLTENMPKCLLTVGGRTILDSIVDKLNAVAEIDEILIVTNDKFYGQLSAWASKTPSRAPVRILNDGTRSNETRLGAIGDLGLVIRAAKIDTDLLMMASDNLFDQDLSAFTAAARSKKDAVSIAIYDIGDPSLAAGKFGVIESGPDGRVKSMEEKPAKPRSSFIGMGVYWFPRTTIPLVSEYLGQPQAQDAPGHYVRWLFERPVPIFSFLFSGMWYDIGDLNALEEANRIFQSKK
ncbi:MAG TPA: nucleotidyltransferase family protein [Candidatus Eisenbacteria bacterium]|nr:nucleotidyltransferase family protein [Candidatus Eisenbacteria bacterium]